MDDLISRREAIERIDAVFPVDPMKSEYAQGIACGAALAKTYVEQLPSVQPQKICVAEIKVDVKDYLDKTIKELKTGEWLHELLQDVIDDGIITEAQAVRIMDKIKEG